MVGVLIRKRDTRGRSAQRHDHVEAKREWSSVKLRRQASDETNPIGTFILDFQLSKLKKKKNYCLSHTI